VEVAKRAQSGKVETNKYYQRIDLWPSQEDPREMVFVTGEGSPKPPPDMVALRTEYGRLARLTAILFDTDKKARSDLFAKYHAAAYIGFIPKDYSIADCKANLLEMQDTLVDKAHELRTTRLAEYTKLMCLFGMAPVIAGLMLFATNGFGLFPHRPDAGDNYQGWVAWILALLFVPAGAVISVWLEFALRMSGGLTYDHLINFDLGRWNPMQRLQISVGTALVFAYLLAEGFVSFGFNGVRFEDFAGKTPTLALAVGGITGLAFTAVKDIIFKLRPVERGTQE
jgi:hypothetical protein